MTFEPCGRTNRSQRVVVPRLQTSCSFVARKPNEKNHRHCRRSETHSISERAVRDRESELTSVQQIARIAGVTVNLRDGFQNERLSPEYLAIHGLPPDATDTHEDWIRRLLAFWLAMRALRLKARRLEGP